MSYLFVVFLLAALSLAGCKRDFDSGEDDAVAKNSRLDSLDRVIAGLDHELDTAASASLPEVRIRELIESSNERYRYVMKGGASGYPFKDSSGIGVFVAMGADLNSEEKIRAYLGEVYSDKVIDELVDGFDLKVRLRRYSMSSPIKLDLPDLSSASIQYEYSDGRTRQYRFKTAKGEVLIEFWDNGGGDWKLGVSAAEIALPFNVTGGSSAADNMTNEELQADIDRLKAANPLTQDE